MLIRMRYVFIGGKFSDVLNEFSRGKYGVMML